MKTAELWRPPDEKRLVTRETAAEEFAEALNAAGDAGEINHLTEANRAWIDELPLKWTERMWELVHERKAAL